MWQFNHCVGSMDGKHVLIKKPANSASSYFNYKKTFSVILFAIVNAKYEFMYVKTGINGSVSDSEVLKNTSFYKKLTSGNLNLPGPQLLPGTDTLAPYVFLGDGAFAIEENIMKPFKHNQLLTYNKRIFNYRLSRARRVVENAFGILSSRFRIFYKPIQLSLKNADSVIVATCYLHNYLRRKSPNYITNSSLDYEDIENGTFHEADWHLENHFLPLERRNPHSVKKKTGEKVRQNFIEYFNGEGNVSFQDRMINVGI